MPSEKFDKVYKRIADFPWQTMGGETIIIEPKNQISHEVNEVGSLVWELIDGESNLSQICEKVCETFDVNEQTASADLVDFVETLKQKGLVHCLN